MGWSHFLLVSVPYSLVFEGLLPDRGGLLSELGPLRGVDAARLDLQESVGDFDLAACPVGLLAPSCPGRPDAVVAVEGSFDG